MPVVSAVRTNYSHMKTEEFLQLLEDTRHRSPIIQELCMRLEYQELHGNKETAYIVECPICLGQLDIDWDDSNNLYTAKVHND